MKITDLRRALEEIRMHAQEGNLDEVRHTADEALHQLAGGQLLTTTEAAELLGIRSVNTLKLLVRRLKVPHEMHGNRMMIPLAALERIQESPEVRGIRASDHAHDMTEGLGAAGGLTAEQLTDLERARPGRLPWQPSDVPSDADTAGGQGEGAAGV